MKNVMCEDKLVKGLLIEDVVKNVSDYKDGYIWVLIILE